jgi:1-acyl-sn-glycerol-3-phosphate acyltransferase
MSECPRLRALWRLVALALRTSAHLSRARVGAHAELERGSVWAQRVLAATGIAVERFGSPPDEPCLLVANHRSYVDIPVLLAQSPCAFLAKREIASWPLFGRAAARIETVFVDRSCPRSRAAARSGVIERLQRGLPVAAFPEGTTSFGPGLRTFFPGLFQEAQQHRFAVCPVAIHYPDPEDAWVGETPFLPHFVDRFRKPRMQVRIAFGEPILAEQVPDLRAHAHGWIEGALHELEGTRAAQAVPT